MNYINDRSNSNLILQNNHPLIERSNNYLLNRKLLTIHSEDRDYSKWKYGNEFEINCPQSYSNIESMRLTEINWPCNYYNFSEYMQNNKFRIKIISPVVADYSIDISDGYYTFDQLANTIANRLNEIILGNIIISPPPLKWYAVYHEVKEKIIIGNNYNQDFELDNTYDFSYNIICGNPSNNHPYYNAPTVKYFNRYNKFNLLSYIGYTEKKIYQSKLATIPPFIDGIPLEYTLGPIIWLPRIGLNIYYIESPKVIDILGEMVIYMEVEYFNSYDELIPWPDTSGNRNCYPLDAKSGNSVKNCPKNTNPRCPKQSSQYPPGPAEPKYIAYRGSGVNSAFAKIPIIAIPKTQIFSSTNGFLFNLSHYSPPIERVSKFKFKFRYHDGRLVDFQDNDFNFTLEINQLVNEILKDKNIRTPAAYRLS